MDVGEYYLLLKRGSDEERRAQFESFFPDRERASRVLAALDSGPLTERVHALCYLSEAIYFGPDIRGAAACTEAAFRVAEELARGYEEDPRLYKMLEDLAAMQAVAQLRNGQYREAFYFTDHWAPFYRALWARHPGWGEGTVLEHAREEARARMEGRPPPLTGGGGAGGGGEPESPDWEDSARQTRAEESQSLGVPRMRPSAAPIAPSSAEPREPRRAQPRPKPVSTGFAHRDSPEKPMTAGESLDVGRDYFFWTELEEVAGSIETTPTPLPVELLPRRARLQVVLFAPDDGLSVDPDADSGEIELQEDGGAVVIRQPGGHTAPCLQQNPQRRLVFPVGARVAGTARLRCSIYCRGVLVQSRVITATVGGTERASRVEFTLATRLAAAELATLRDQRLSLHINAGSLDQHDFYIHGPETDGAYNKSIRIPADQLEKSLKVARSALRAVSWGDEEAWSTEKRYRYESEPTMRQLHDDLDRLAIAGRRVFDVIADEIESSGARVLQKISALAAEPGQVQITADVRVGMVLPAAMIYDYPLAFELQSKERLLCPEFERAYADRTPLGEAACFTGRCPSKGKANFICPSGFWGFRHALGLPVSCVGGEEADEPSADSGLAARIEYQDVPVLIVGISKSPDLPQTGPNTDKLLGLKPEWRESAWVVRDSLPPLLEAMRSRQPHLVYMYCHGTLRKVENAGIPMLFFGVDVKTAPSSEWFEKAMLRGNVEWSRPKPLVFLNGCRTTMLDETTILNFVRGFVQNAHACGVIGTEITVFESLAGAFATSFMSRFLAGSPVGDSVRAARLDLLQQGNPLGLVYTPFVLSDTRLVRGSST